MPSVGVGVGIGQDEKSRGGGGGSDLVVASVELTPASGSGATGDVLEFRARALNAAGKGVPGKTFTAHSSDTDVATVAVNGHRILVTLVASGTATVTASSGGHTSNEVEVEDTDEPPAVGALPDASDIVLKLIPGTDDAGSVASIGGAYEKLGTVTLLSDGSGYEFGPSTQFTDGLRFDQKAPATPRVYNQLIASPNGWTIYAVAKLGTHQAGFILAADNCSNTNFFWGRTRFDPFAANVQNRLELIVPTYSGILVPFNGADLGLEEQFGYGPFDGSFVTNDGAAIDGTNAHVFVVRYYRTQTGGDRVAMWIDSTKLHRDAQKGDTTTNFPGGTSDDPTSGDHNEDAVDDGSAPVCESLPGSIGFPLELPGNQGGSGLETHYFKVGIRAPLAANAARAAERIGAIFGIARSQTDQEVLDSVAWLQANHPLLTT